MAAANKSSVDAEVQLANFVAQFYADPYGFVMAMYPWGEPTLPDGSYNPLRDKHGPEPWQKLLLLDLGEHIRANVIMVRYGCENKTWRSAVASGHGVGKSAEVAWLIEFFMSTRPNTRGVVTANTQPQLETKTWPELGKWHNLLLCKHWFTFTATSYYFSQYGDDRRRNYMVNAQTVSDENTEAFAGLHNEGGCVLIIADEASGISEKVFEVAEGALTDGEAFLFLFGNPTRPEGEFYKCFSDDNYRGLYKTYSVDSRQVSHTNKQAIRDLIAKYGNDENHDVIKVRVRGMFPDQSFDGFIGISQVMDAQERELFPDNDAALIMGVDVARLGRDTSVVSFRQGRDARTRKRLVYGPMRTTRLADLLMIEIDKERPDAIVIESVGPGVAIIDILRDRGYRVIEVHPGAPSGRPREYVNVRAEMWDNMRQWIDTEGCLWEDTQILQQLTTVRYKLKKDETAIQIEAKEDMKARGLPSPDDADSLALTFAVRIARRDRRLAGRAVTGRSTFSETEYDPINY